MIITKTNSVGILSTNIQFIIIISINSIKWRSFIQELRLLNYVFSVICIHERWLTEQDDLCNIQLEDYTSIFLGKTTSTKGGLIIYIYAYPV